MSEKTDPLTERNGGPAFPGAVDLAAPQGMSLRDWFASQVDVSGIQFTDTDEASRALNIDPPADESLAELVRWSFRAQAAIRFAMADAMIAERCK